MINTWVVALFVSPAIRHGDQPCSLYGDRAAEEMIDRNGRSTVSRFDSACRLLLFQSELAARLTRTPGHYRRLLPARHAIVTSADGFLSQRHQLFQDSKFSHSWS